MEILSFEWYIGVYFFIGLVFAAFCWYPDETEEGYSECDPDVVIGFTVFGVLWIFFLPIAITMAIAHAKDGEE